MNSQALGVLTRIKKKKNISNGLVDMLYKKGSLSYEDITYLISLRLIDEFEKNHDNTMYVEYEIENEIEHVISMMINLFIRRNLVLTPKASNVRSACNAIRKYIVDHDLKGDELLLYFNKEIRKIMPTDDMLKFALNEGIYDTNKKTTRFILIMLERHFGNYFHDGNVDTLDGFSGSKLRWTIEHIVPQGSLPDYWTADIGNGDLETAEELQRANVHRLGNLTLTPYNSGMGQSSFVDKVNYRDPHNQAEVGLRLPIYLNSSIDVESDKFDIGSINDRSMKLETLLLEMLAL